MVVVVGVVVGVVVVEPVVGLSVRGVMSMRCVPTAWEPEHRSVPAWVVDASCALEAQRLLQPVCWQGRSSTGCSECVAVDRIPRAVRIALDQNQPAVDEKEGAVGLV